MSQQKICLASDNWTSVHPDVLQAIIDANESFSPAYGSDLWTEKAQESIRQAFYNKCKVFIVPSGTGANILALKLGCRRYESVICTDVAHIQTNECGAAESIVGCKLLLIPHENGKLTPQATLRKLKSERTNGKHATSPRVLSITQPTEFGTVYQLEELRALSKLCREEKLLFHIDGSRIYNAAATLGVSLYDIAAAARVDLLSLGGTKNGLMGAEALLIFNPSLEEGCDHMHKQTLQLMSKMRYLSAQYVPLFKNDLWRTLAAHANVRAQEIAAIIESMPHLSLSYPVETNQVFFTAPQFMVAQILEEIHSYVWNEEKNEIRFVASWNTSEQDVKAVKSILEKVVYNGARTK